MDEQAIQGARPTEAVRQAEVPPEAIEAVPDYETADYKVDAVDAAIDISAEPANEDGDGEPEIEPAENDASDRIWNDFDRVADPSMEQMDAFLDALLALPPEATMWSEVFEILARKKHADLPGAFRRIVALVPATKATQLNYLYWDAIEHYVKGRRVDLIPEVVAHFCRLDRDTYDIEALHHSLFWILAAGCDAEALALAEHFLPITGSDADLLPHALDESQQMVFDLRVAVRLRERTASGGEPATIAHDWIRNFEDIFHRDFVQRAAEVIAGGPISACLLYTSDAADE